MNKCTVSKKFFEEQQNVKFSYSIEYKWGFVRNKKGKVDENLEDHECQRCEVSCPRQLEAIQDI